MEREGNRPRGGSRPTARRGGGAACSPPPLRPRAGLPCPISPRGAASVKGKISWDGAMTNAERKGSHEVSIYFGGYVVQ